MSSKYSENSKKIPPYQYEKLEQTQMTEKCQGDCSCNSGERTVYDREQSDRFANNAHIGSINFPIVKNISGWK